MVEEWNRPAMTYDGYVPIHELIAAGAAKHPTATALVSSVDPGRTMTFREMNEKANRIAHQLRQEGVVPGTVTGLCMERSLDMILGLLAIFKAGGVYVPLDPDYPRERPEYMVRDSGMAVVLIHGKTRERIRPVAGEGICLVDVDRKRSVIARRSKKNPSCTIPSADTAYVLYTSGSTGRPRES